MKARSVTAIATAVLAAFLVLSSGARSHMPDRSAFEARAQAHRSRLSSAFTVVVQPPFVVIGDNSPAAVRRRATGTIQWMVDQLKREYFAKDPQEIIDVWLFKDGASYYGNAKKLLGDSPDTPFGYYSPAHNALVMNIGTGGGTLTHEIVHPYMAANFPACPAWFNEGMGSLYEQCGEVNGRIHGFPNWRLPALQRAIRAGKAPAFKVLLSKSDEAFYREEKGPNYAEARYLCYYLQEKGLLRKYYHAFVAHHREDPTGYQTLRQLLGNPDMASFQKQWNEFVLGLDYP